MRTEVKICLEHKARLNLSMIGAQWNMRHTTKIALVYWTDKLPKPIQFKIPTALAMNMTIIPTRCNRRYGKIFSAPNSKYLTRKKRKIIDLLPAVMFFRLRNLHQTRSLGQQLVLETSLESRRLFITRTKLWWRTENLTSSPRTRTCQ